MCLPAHWLSTPFPLMGKGRDRGAPSDAAITPTSILPLLKRKEVILPRQSYFLKCSSQSIHFSKEVARNTKFSS
jgi:hypothetical protein